MFGIPPDAFNAQPARTRMGAWRRVMHRISNVCKFADVPARWCRFFKALSNEHHVHTYIYILSALFYSLLRKSVFFFCNVPMLVPASVYTFY